MDEEDLRSRFQGCLLGGAVGDALGAPVEFLPRSEIMARFGKDGIQEYATAYGGLGMITDDTQMTLFTTEGLLRGHVRGSLRGMCHRRSVIASAYERWLYTQGIKTGMGTDDSWLNSGWLIGQRELHSRRAPGNTCLASLRDMQSYGDLAKNDSKGCGGVMRVAPVGLFCWPNGDAFELGVEAAAITHGHPSGYLAGGVLAELVKHLLLGETLPQALQAATRRLAEHDHHEETLKALKNAISLAESRDDPARAIDQLGQGWVADEALAISVYCALVAHDFHHGVCLAVNHDGDSDSTGAITGNLLGAILGEEIIPSNWLDPLELREVIRDTANDLLDCNKWDIGDFDASDNDWVWEKYPGF